MVKSAPRKKTGAGIDEVEADALGALAGLSQAVSEATGHEEDPSTTEQRVRERYQRLRGLERTLEEVAHSPPCAPET